MLFSRVGLGRGKTIYVLYKDGKFERYDDTNP
jgi:eukaryotic-like serine/threonine-protein kinase